MAIKLIDEYPGRANPADSYYPGGSFKNESTEGANNGTPVDNTWAKDKDGFFQGMLVKANMLADGSTDTAIASQFLDALDYVARGGPRSPRIDAEALCSGMHLFDTWWSPSAVQNKRETAVTYRDSCMGINATNGKSRLFVNSSTAIFHFELDDYDSIAAPITFLPTLTSVDKLCSCCCDGSYLYLAWFQTAGNLMVSKFNLSLSVTPVWTCDTLIDASTLSDDFTKLIVADTNNIAILFGDTATYFDANIGIINKSTSVFYYGTGNSDVGTSKVILPNAKIVSNGTSIFWIGYNSGSGEYELCAADIDDPTTATPTRAEIGSVSVRGHQRGICCTGPMVVMSSTKGYVTAYSPADDAILPMARLIDPTPYEATPDYDSICEFDGMNVWFSYVYEGATVNGIGFRAIPAAWFSRYLNTAYRELSPIPLFADVDTSTIYTAPLGKLLSDGKDMWFVCRAGDIYRICNPGMR